MQPTGNYINNISRHDDDDWVCPPGESGPRRKTIQDQQQHRDGVEFFPMEIAAANAEATRLAQELGVSSSANGHSARLITNSSKTLRSKQRRGLNLFTRSNNNQNNNSSQLGSLSQRHRHQQQEEEEPSSAYQAVLSDGTVIGFSQPNIPGHSSTINDNIDGNNSSQLSYKNSIYYDEEDDDIHTVCTSEPGLFDSSGMRAPYREGPYDFHHDEDGRLVKKRWCKFTIQF
jgi:hypothetical protein